MPEAANAEVLRLHYLQAMGIVSYYPRFALPGAKPSEACEWPFGEEADASVPGAAPAIAAAKIEAKAEAGSETKKAEPPAKPRVAAGLRDEISPRGRLEESTKPADLASRKPAAATSANAEAGAAPNFQLLLLRVDEELAVLAQIPALAPPRLAEKQSQLLDNILRWLGRSSSPAAPRAFIWPLPGLPVNSTRAEAGTGVLHFLEQARLEQSFRRVLVLGELAADCLHARLDTLGQASAWQVFHTHSLDEMLALPQLKRSAWQSLLPLHAILAAAASQA